VGRNEVILLDTHAILWMANEDPALGRDSRLKVQVAREQGQLAISSISFWEIALLSEKRRLKLLESPEALRLELLNTGIIEIPLTGEITILAAQLKNLHGDPADRFIVATAIAQEATLLTADKALLRWRNELPRQNAAK
jgi:PIN domain nuclease of toxin-antitoxin system